MSTEPSSGPSSSLRVVLDTNVYVSAFLHPNRPIHHIWRCARERQYHLVTSRPIINELAAVLRGESFLWPQRRIIRRLRAVARIGTIVEPDFTLNVITEDPPDNRILECAVAGDANLIVSGNRHLLRLRSYEGIAVVRPRDFMRMLGIGEG